MNNLLNPAYLSQNKDNLFKFTNINQQIYGPTPTYSPFNNSSVTQSYYLNNMPLMTNNLNNMPLITNNLNNISLLTNNLNNTSIFSNNNTITKPSKYFLVPGQDYQYNYYYQNINKDPSLRKQITEFYTDELYEWFEYDSSLSKLKSIITKSNYKKNRNTIYKILRQFVNSYNVNWFDLKDYYRPIKKEIFKHFV
jgi:hypothetical protein